MENWFFDHFFSYFQGFRRLLANFSPLTFSLLRFGGGDFPAGVEFRRVGGGGEFPPPPMSTSGVEPSSGGQKLKSILRKHMHNIFWTHWQQFTLSLDLGMCPCPVRALCLKKNNSEWGFRHENSMEWACKGCAKWTFSIHMNMAMMFMRMNGGDDVCEWWLDVRKRGE